MESANNRPPWESTKRPAGKRILRKLITWTLVLGALGVIGYGLRSRPVEVEAAEAKRGPLTVHVVEEGKTRIRNRYVVSTTVAGQMHRVTLRAGDDVKAGDTVITTIEPAVSPLLDPRAKAQAEAAVQMSTAARMRAEQSLSMAKTAEKFALSNWKRVENLTDKGSLSITDRDAAERDASMKQQEVHGAEFALQVAEFELQQAKAALLQMQSPGTQGSTIEVRAPVSGKVLKVMQESATVVAPGAQLIEIGDPSDIEIEAEILSRDAVTIKPGADVIVEQWGGVESLRARVKIIEPAAFTKVSALGVEEQRVIVRSELVQPPEAAKVLGDRYRVEVRIAIWHSDDVLLVPAGALFREGSDWKTLVFDNGKAKKVAIEVGHTDGRNTEVTKGLDASAKVLVHPPDTVKDGSDIVRRQ